ncbi:MAG: MMPL family transporter [Planctomycetes bacterium]|nr:MMPL family transporter [Planctomycetota bacterium]
MFQVLGNVVARFWPIWLALWVLALALAWRFAPSWQTVVDFGEVGSLPPRSPSVRGDRLCQEAFPNDYAPSSIVLVFTRADGEVGEKDFEFTKRELTERLSRSISTEQKDLIAARRTPDENGSGALLVSPDKKSALVLVELKTPFQDPRNVAIIDSIEKVLEQLRAEKKLPAGLEAAVAGSAVAGRDLDRAEADSVRAIEVWTIVIVIALLMLLYRAPVAALIPLATVFVAVGVALPMLTSLAKAGVFSLSADLRVFITVLSYGAGVDYCMFLIARYREELDAGAQPRHAVSRAIAKVGGAITASAATVIFGIGALAFAHFAKIHQAGLVIPLALTVALLGTLTFAGPLLALAGPWAFWPERVDRTAKHARPRLLQRLLHGRVIPDLWPKLADLLLRRPGGVWLGTVAVMMPLVIIALLHRDDTNFNPLSDLPPDAPSAVGTRALEKHFPVGALGSVVILVQNDHLDFSGDAGVKKIDSLTQALISRRDELELADVRSIALPLGTSVAAREQLTEIKGKKENVESAVREEAERYYLSREGNMAGHVTRIDLTLDTNPLNRRGIASLERIEKALPELLPAGLRGSRIEIIGPTASLRDLSDVKRDDERLIQILAPVIVFVLLVILLRRVIVSAYLIVSVLFSYFATLGLTYLVFSALGGPDFDGLDWKVPIFLFTILVAVGEDYNIFLLTRVQEEQARHGPLNAIPIALARTGSVISSCGLIMAGTFASLLSGSLRAMKELGFALAVGVMIDTLVVRPILVPAFLILVQRIFPGRFGREMALGERESQTAASQQN